MIKYIISPITQMKPCNPIVMTPKPNTLRNVIVRFSFKRVKLIIVEIIQELKKIPINDNKLCNVTRETANEKNKQDPTPEITNPRFVGNENKL